MTATDRHQLAEKLLRFISTCPSVPVKGGRFSLDGVGAELPGMSIMFAPGKFAPDVLGAESVSQPFGLYYKSKDTENDATKAAMAGAINEVGYWLKDLSDSAWPDLGKTIKIFKLQQITTAHLVQRDNGELLYVGDFLLVYDQE